MARCDFCGSKAGFNLSINRDIFDFKTCPDCYERLKDASDIEVICEAYRAGLYYNLGALEEKIEEYRQSYDSDVEKYMSWIAGNTVGACPKCGGPMIQNGIVKVLTYTESFPLNLDINKWNTRELEIEAHICEDCGYTEVYSKDGVERRRRFAAMHDAFPKEDEE